MTESIDPAAAEEALELARWTIKLIGSEVVYIGPMEQTHDGIATWVGNIGREMERFEDRLRTIEDGLIELRPADWPTPDCGSFTFHHAALRALQSLMECLQELWIGGAVANDDPHAFLDHIQVRLRRLLAPIHERIERENWEGQLLREANLLKQPPAYSFTLDGSQWVIRFNGETVKAKDCKGAQYVYALIEHQGRPLSASELYRAVNPPPSLSVAPGAVASSGIEAGFSEDGTSLEATDIQTIHDSKARAQEIKDELDETVSDETRRKLIAELEEIKDYLTANRDNKGQARKAGGNQRRNFDSIRKAIEYFYANELDGTELLNHLRSSIRLTATECKYHPPHSLDWHIH